VSADAQPTATDLARRLQTLSPRAQQVLRFVVLERQTFGQTAETFGVNEPAVEILFLRALKEWRQASSWSPENEEEAEAAALRRCWEGGGAGSSRIAALEAPLRTLAERSSAILEAQRQLVSDEEQSPRARRRERFRQWAIILIVLASMYLYWRAPR